MYKDLYDKIRNKTYKYSLQVSKILDTLDSEWNRNINDIDKIINEFVTKMDKAISENEFDECSSSSDTSPIRSPSHLVECDDSSSVSQDTNFSNKSYESLAYDENSLCTTPNYMLKTMGVMLILVIYLQLTHTK